MVQYHVFIGRFCHASRFQPGLVGFKPRLIPGHFDYFKVLNVYTQKLRRFEFAGLKSDLIPGLKSNLIPGHL